MNVIKEFEIEIAVPAKDANLFVKDGKFLGFTVNQYKDAANFSLHGTPDKEYTIKDIMDMVTPPKDTDYTKISNTFLMYLAFVRRQIQDIDMNSTGAQRYFANNGNGYQVSTYFKLGPETPKKPRIDGAVTGYLWNVCIGLKYRTTGVTTCIQDIIFCIKPESAVHEALDRMFRKDPHIMEKFEILTPIEVSKTPTKVVEGSTPGLYTEAEVEAMSPLQQYEYVIMP